MTNIASNIQHSPDNYRYPGSRPFQDTDHDRRIFFGREQEAESLLHLILAEHLVVLFAKSGMGKTSLLNAGVLQPLRERGFLPLKIRFRDPNTDPLQTVYAAIEETVALRHIEYKAGEKLSLWHYFKSVEFWSADDILLTPVLILDQFEEFFHLYLPERRKAFITQFADLVKGRKPQTFQENESAYTDTPPNVKVIISIREDFIGQLEEMAREIPAILQNRFRILPLNREQARQAIIEPASIEDDTFHTTRFHYAPDAVDAMLDFLCKRRKERDSVIIALQERSAIKKCLLYVPNGIKKIATYFYKHPQNYATIVTNEVEPCQLQLLCNHIENTFSRDSLAKNAEFMLHKDDLGGEIGMQRVLQYFYDSQLKQIKTFSERQKVRRLCEKGLISLTDRRLSLEEEEIERKFKVSTQMLSELVNSRLLRAESRVGSIYYELSHDTLVAPIRRSQKKRQTRRSTICGGILLFIILSSFLLISSMILSPSVENDLLLQLVKKVPFLQEKISSSFFREGKILYRKGKYDEAKDNFQKAILTTSHAADISDSHTYLGRIFFHREEYENAIEYFKKAIETFPYSSIEDKDKYKRYFELGYVYFEQKKFDDAIEYFQQTVQLKSDYAPGFFRLGEIFSQQGKYEKATIPYLKAFLLDPKGFYSERLIKVLEEQQLDVHDIEIHLNQIENDPEKAKFYNQLGSIFNQIQRYDEAIEVFNHGLKKLRPGEQYGKYVCLNLGDALLQKGSYNQAIEQFKKSIAIDPQYIEPYNYWGRTLYRQGRYEEAIEQYKQALELPCQPEYKANLYNNLGYAFFFQGNYDKAKEQFDLALEIKPDFPNSYHGIGQILFKQRKYGEAIESFQKAISYERGYANAYYNLGRTFNRLEKFTEAIENYEKARALNSNLNPADFFSAYKKLGTRSYEEKNFNDAIRFFEEALQINPEDHDVIYYLGDIYYQQKQHDEAAIHYLKAFQLAPENYKYYNALMGNLPEDYSEHFKNNITVIYLHEEPDVLPIAYNNVGFTLLELHKYKESFMFFEKAYQIDPEHIFIRISFVLANLVSEFFERAANLAQQVLQEENISDGDRLTLRFFSISSLVFQKNKREAMTQIEDFVEYYAKLSKSYEKNWNYTTIGEFISDTEKLSEAEKTLLLKLVDILETPKPQADSKLQELETLLEQWK